MNMHFLYVSPAYYVAGILLNGNDKKEIFDHINRILDHLFSCN